MTTLKAPPRQDRPPAERGASFGLRHLMFAVVVIALILAALIQFGGFLIALALTASPVILVVGVVVVLVERREAERDEPPELDLCEVESVHRQVGRRTIEGVDERQRERGLAGTGCSGDTQDAWPARMPGRPAQPIRTPDQLGHRRVEAIIERRVVRHPSMMDRWRVPIRCRCQRDPSWSRANASWT